VKDCQLLHRGTKDKQSRIIVDPAEKTRTITNLHLNPVGGSHFGQTATIRKITERFWWPNVIIYLRLRLILRSAVVLQQAGIGMFAARKLMLLCFKVWPTKVGAKWARKDVDIADHSQSVRIKLWSGKTEPQVEEGQVHTFTHLITNYFNGETSLNSTPQTVCEVCDSYVNRKY